MMQLIESTKEMFRDSRFLRKALMIACPVALQGMLNTVVNLVDTLMIGTMGATAIAAVGLAISSSLFFRFWYSELSAEAAYWRPSSGETAI